jgi:hypothetical protein
MHTGPISTQASYRSTTVQGFLRENKEKSFVQSVQNHILIFEETDKTPKDIQAFKNALSREFGRADVGGKRSQIDSIKLFEKSIRAETVVPNLRAYVNPLDVLVSGKNGTKTITDQIIKTFCIGLTDTQKLVLHEIAACYGIQAPTVDETKSDAKSEHPMNRPGFGEGINIAQSFATAPPFNMEAQVRAEARAARSQEKWTSHHQAMAAAKETRDYIEADTHNKRLEATEDDIMATDIEVMYTLTANDAKANKEATELSNTSAARKATKASTTFQQTYYS